MEIQFQPGAVPVCRELARQTKSVHIAMESVVPDTKDDIGRILSVRSEIYLKSKELRIRGAAVGGEAAVTLLYVNEAQDAVRSFCLTQPYSIEYELPEAEEGCVLQARLLPCTAQARLLNARKVAVELELSCELTVCGSAELCVSQSPPEDLFVPLHVQTEELSSLVDVCACEKGFSVSEQLPFPPEAARPAEIAAKQIDYLIRDKQTVGSRLLVKGEAELLLYCLPEDGPAIGCSRFTLPFSQLIDLGENEAESAELWVEPSSDYVELIDTVDGQKLLNVDLHALLQARGRRTQAVACITDAYSNSMPCSCRREEETLVEAIEAHPVALCAEERLELPEEYRELTLGFASLGPCSASQGSLSLDLLCKTEGGTLSVMHRSLPLTAQGEVPDGCCGAFRLADCRLKQEGNEVAVSARAEGQCCEMKTKRIERVAALELDEEHVFDLASYPSVTAVWAETETVWELAKLYHSSPEAIRALNGDKAGNPVFIPKCQ